MIRQAGFKPLPISLKVLFILLALWTIGSIFALAPRMSMGLPFFGLWVSGITAGSIVLILDIISPLTFLYGLWSKKDWAPKIAYGYMGVFVLNSIIATFTFREQLGLMPILIPALVTLLFMGLVYRKRTYFR